MTDTVLSHVVARFTPRQWENVATESLKFLFDRGAGEAPARALSGVAALPAGLRWRAQATSSEDVGIPDLVGEDTLGRPAVIIEGKFWAGLTENQPGTYLTRQERAFVSTNDPHVMLFLVPTRRQVMIAAELAAIMGSSTLPTMVSGLTMATAGARSVLVMSWGRMLQEVQTCLEEARDAQGLANLEQLRGLCDRADAQAMRPFAAEELGSEVAQRICDLADLLDEVVEELHSRGIVTLKGLKSVGGKNYYGRHLRAPASGRVFQLSLLFSSWAHLHPTPIWLRIWAADAADKLAWSGLEGTEGIPHVSGGTSDHWYRMGLAVPRGVEARMAASRMADAVERAIAALPAKAEVEGAAEVDSEAVAELADEA